MKVPTKRVMRNGEEVVINTSDFDPKVHKEKDMKAEGERIKAEAERLKAEADAKGARK